MKALVLKALLLISLQWGINAIASDYKSSQSPSAEKEKQESRKQCLFKNAANKDWLIKNKERVLNDYREFFDDSNQTHSALLKRLDAHNQVVDFVRTKFSPMPESLITQLQEIQKKYKAATSVDELNYWQKKFLEAFRASKIDQKSATVEFSQVLEVARKITERSEGTLDPKVARILEFARNSSGKNAKNVPEFDALINADISIWQNTHRALWLYQNNSAIQNYALSVLPDGKSCNAFLPFAKYVLHDSPANIAQGIYSQIQIDCGKSPSLQIFSHHLNSDDAALLNKEPLKAHFEVKTIADTTDKISTAISPKTSQRTTSWVDRFGRSSRAGNIQSLAFFVERRYGIVAKDCSNISPNSSETTELLQDADFNGELQNIEKAL